MPQKKKEFEWANMIDYMKEKDIKEPTQFLMKTIQQRAKFNFRNVIAMSKVLKGKPQEKPKPTRGMSWVELMQDKLKTEWNKQKGIVEEEEREKREA